jgi:hypothetical protein
MDRFEKHMTGKGGVWIKKDLEEGVAAKDDFVIEVLEEGNEPDEYYKAMEEYYIDYFDTLHPRGYNGNKGNYIVVTPETIKKSLETRRKNFEAGLWEYKTGKPGHAIYRYPTGEVKQLSINHPDVINGLAKHVNYNPSSKFQTSKRKKAEERLKNGGLTDAQVLVKSFYKSFGQRLIKHPNFWMGRQKMAERHARREFTDAELNCYEQRSETVKQVWSKIPAADRKLRTQDGLQIMNSKFKCSHCGIETNKGNYHRWHGNNCKHKKQV